MADAVAQALSGGAELRGGKPSPMIPVIPPCNLSMPTIEKENAQNNEFPIATSAVSTKFVSPATQYHKEINEGKLSSPVPVPQSSGELSASVAITGRRRPLLPRAALVDSSQSDARRPILRYGETIEALFLIDQHSAEGYRTECLKLLDGDTVDDPAAWKVVLEYASNQAAHDPSKGRDLLRLHRRATSRFHDRSTSDSLSLWLLYARAQVRYGAEKDARLTLRHIENHPLGKNASYYLVLSELEQQSGNKEAARRILQLGLAGETRPSGAFEAALRALDSNDRREELAVQVPTSSLVHSALSPRKRKLEQQSSPKRLKTENGWMDVWRGPPENSQSREERTESSNMSIETDGALESTSSIRFQLVPLPRLQLNSSLLSQDDSRDNAREQASAATDSKLEGEVSDRSEAKVNRICPFRAESQLSTATAPKSLHVGKASDRKDPIVSSDSIEDERKSNTIVADRNAGAPLLQAELLRSGFLASAVPQPPQNQPISRMHQPSAAKFVPRRPPLLSKVPRFSKLHTIGKAQRVDNSLNIGLDPDSEDDTAEVAPSPRVESINSESPAPPKVPKLDLSYMWAWDPSSKLAASTTVLKSSNALTAKRLMLGRIDEAHESSSSNGSGSNGVVLNGAVSNGAGSNVSGSNVSGSNGAGSYDAPASSSKTCLTAASLPSNGHAERSADSNDPLNRTSCHTPGELTVDPRSTSLLSRLSMDFLPLVSENNILRVNNTSYAKLGVIGKGGSCKVYRALSKDCSVVAIKKVKLAGMDKKAIDGYANEIALLKRLRGNNAIIQLYQSEVDLSRKAIFLVMELGEVDLNQVLQQQAMLSDVTSCDNHRHLNMNFIRLTWHQMLSAVHCIHEERIIHSDLKPANFLFVRGALKLIDFGIAKAIQNDDTTNIYRESQVGTLNYMSPEAILDSGSGVNGASMRLGRASDVWSLGCILYQMVYGKTPFADLHMLQKLQAIVNPSHDIAYPFVADSDALDAMQKCLRRKPDDRPPIVGDDGLLNEHCFLNSRSCRTECSRRP